jgi:hypothetical protein
VRAYATRAGYNDSPVTSQSYHFNAYVPPTVPTPTIEPTPAAYYIYTLPPTITLACPQATATIQYSVDGAVYTPYGAPFVLPLPADTSVSRDIVVSAYATCSGYTDSAVAVVTYRFLAKKSIMTIGGNGGTGYSGDGGPATDGQLGAPYGVCLDGAGNVYVSDPGHHVIRKIDIVTGTISTFAGTGIAGYSGDSGDAKAAQLSSPSGLTANNTTLFVADAGNNRVRAIAFASGVITTYAGNGTAGYGGDGGDRLAAALNHPLNIAVDNNGKNLYIADTQNHRVRKIVIADGIITTIAGTGTSGNSGDGALATAATLSFPAGVGLRQSNKDIVIADTGNHRLRVIDGTTGILSAFAGTGVAGFSGNGGSTTAAQLNTPTALFVDNAAVYVSDTGNHCVRIVDGGIITAYAGTGAQGFAGDGGPAASALLYSPLGLLMTNTGDYIVDSSNGRIRLILEY